MPYLVADSEDRISLYTYTSQLTLCTSKTQSSLDVCSHLLMYFGGLICKHYVPRSDCSLKTQGSLDVCSHLLMYFGGLICKHYVPRSDCSLRSSLIRVHSVCFRDKSSLKRICINAADVMSEYMAMTSVELVLWCVCFVLFVFSCLTHGLCTCGLIE